MSASVVGGLWDFIRKDDNIFIRSRSPLVVKNVVDVLRRRGLRVAFIDGNSLDPELTISECVGIKTLTDREVRRFLEGLNYDALVIFNLKEYFSKKSKLLGSNIAEEHLSRDTAFLTKLFETNKLLKKPKKIVYFGDGGSEEVVALEYELSKKSYIVPTYALTYIFRGT